MDISNLSLEELLQLSAEIAKRRLELEKTIVTLALEPDKYHFTSKMSRLNNDVLRIDQSFVTRKYFPDRQLSRFPLAIFKRYREAVSALNGIQVVIDPQDEATINELLSAKELNISFNPETDQFELVSPFSYLYSKVDATLHDLGVMGTTKFTLPANHGEKLVRLHPPSDRVAWTESALELAEKEIRLRQKLNLIAQKEYSEFGDIGLSNNNEMRPFQTVSVEFGEATGYRYLVGDEMGLGKTIQGIAAAIKSNAKKIVVICPAMTKVNWERQIKKFTGELAYTFRGIAPDEFDMRLLLENKYRWHIINYDLISRAQSESVVIDGKLTAKKRYPWIDLFNIAFVDFVIVDEAHYAKNITSSRSGAIRALKSKHIVGLTGTPVLNRPSELWSFFNVIDPKAFPSHDFFTRRYAEGKNGVRNKEELRSLLSRYMIRRLKSQVMKDLPPITRTDVQVDISSEQKEIYNKLFESILVDFKTGEEIKQMEVLEKLLRIKQFLSECKVPSVVDIVNDILDSSDDTQPYQKVIVFSQFVPVVHSVSRALGSKALRIVGSETTIEKRQELVDRFQTDPNIKVLVCSIEAAGVGLDMTEAGHVVFADFMWNPAKHQQAEARAYGRLNDAHTIESHYVAVTDSLDDWLQGILLEKTKTIDETVDNIDSQRNADTSVVSQLFELIKNGKITKLK